MEVWLQLHVCKRNAFLLKMTEKHLHLKCPTSNGAKLKNITERPLSAIMISKKCAEL